MLRGKLLELLSFCWAASLIVSIKTIFLIIFMQTASLNEMCSCWINIFQSLIMFYFHSFVFISFFSKNKMLLVKTLVFRPIYLRKRQNFLVCTFWNELVWKRVVVILQVDCRFQGKNLVLRNFVLCAKVYQNVSKVTCIKTEIVKTLIQIFWAAFQ